MSDDDPADITARAGMSDAAVQAKTGRSWQDWVQALDAAGAGGLAHGEIARLVGERYAIPGWWAQTVTVGYERIKGLRAVGQRRGSATFEANKSKTFPVSVARLYGAFADAGLRARWLPGDGLTVRTAVAEKSMRMTWPDGTSVHAYFTAMGPDKARLAIQHTRLPDAAAIARRKAWWTERLTALAALLE